MSKGDFHTHSTNSDGVRSPTELVDLASEHGVRVMALTDHDTLAGLDEAEAAAARHPGFLLVPGVELSCDVPGTEVHVLGYFIDRDDARSRSNSRRSAPAASTALSASLARSNASARPSRGSACRRSPARHPWAARTSRRRCSRQATSRPSARRSTASSAATAPLTPSVPKLEPPEAIEMIGNAGGIAVFAHPGFTKEYERIAGELADAGLFGLEAYYKHYDPETVASLVALAERLGVFALGGSDHHGIDRDEERQPGEIPLPDAVVDAFLDAARARGCRVPEPAS